jgi:hypothetical protein
MKSDAQQGGETLAMLGPIGISPGGVGGQRRRSGDAAAVVRRCGGGGPAWRLWCSGCMHVLWASMQRVPTRGRGRARPRQLPGSVMMASDTGRPRQEKGKV